MENPFCTLGFILAVYDSGKLNPFILVEVNNHGIKAYV